MTTATSIAKAIAHRQATLNALPGTDRRSPDYVNMFRFVFKVLKEYEVELKHEGLIVHRKV